MENRVNKRNREEAETKVINASFINAAWKKIIEKSRARSDL